MACVAHKETASRSEGPDEPHYIWLSRGWSLCICSHTCIRISPGFSKMFPAPSWLNGPGCSTSASPVLWHKSSGKSYEQVLQRHKLSWRTITQSVSDVNAVGSPHVIRSSYSDCHQSLATNCYRSINFGRFVHFEVLPKDVTWSQTIRVEL